MMDRAEGRRQECADSCIRMTGPGIRLRLAQSSRELAVRKEKLKAEDHRRREKIEKEVLRTSSPLRELVAEQELNRAAEGPQKPTHSHLKAHAEEVPWKQLGDAVAEQELKCGAQGLQKLIQSHQRQTAEEEGPRNRPLSRLGERDKQLQHQPKEPAADRALKRGADGPERQTCTQRRKPVEGAPEWQPGPEGPPRGQRVGRTQPGRLLTEGCSRSLQAHQGRPTAVAAEVGEEEEEEEEEWSRLHRTDRYQTRRG